MTVCIAGILLGPFVYAQSYDIGVFYFPGWSIRPDMPWNRAWEPIKNYPEREPLIGYYPEGETWVAEKQIEWASQYGIQFFIYDWYWTGNASFGEHALKAYLSTKNRDKVKFCLLWANHSEVPRNLKEFDDMVAYWIDHYFKEPTYYSIKGKPAIYIFSYRRLDINARTFGESGRSLLARADAKSVQKGYKGIYFIATTNEKPETALERKLTDVGFSAYTGWNYVAAKIKDQAASYDSMVDTYLDFYNAAAKTGHLLPYQVPASPGWDSRPWEGKAAHYRENATPEKFRVMLRYAKTLMDSQPDMTKILVIEAWNEFGEGAYIEPTKKWGFQYLESIKQVFVK
jgi:hypothetical protein